MRTATNGDLRGSLQSPGHSCRCSRSLGAASAIGRTIQPMARNGLRTERRPYSSPIRKAHADATRRSIMSAARAVFSDSGYEGATIESVAAAARVSAPTVYALFRSKAGLLSAVVADGGSDPDIRA